MPDVEMIDIPVVLSKKIDEVIYNLMVKTITDQVFQGEHTLTEILAAMTKAIDGKTSEEDFRKMERQLKIYFEGAPEDFNTIVEIHQYMTTLTNTQNDLAKMLKAKVDIISYNQDMTSFNNTIQEIKRDMLNYQSNYVTEEVFNLRLKTMEENLRKVMYNNLIVSAGDTVPEELVDNGIWLNLLEKPKTETTGSTN